MEGGSHYRDRTDYQEGPAGENGYFIWTAVSLETKKADSGIVVYSQGDIYRSGDFFSERKNNGSYRPDH